MNADPRIGPGNISRISIADTPVTMSRNRALAAAEKHKIDYLLMIDSDMHPDIPTDAPSKPFWDSSWEFVQQHRGPCVIAAPYCGPPPHENVFVFRWSDLEGTQPNPSFLLQQYTRFEAVQQSGIKPADALATGLMLIDVKAVANLRHPRFYYEWTDEKQIAKASTEDVTFSRDLRLAGVPLYCNWDAWAGHYKTKRVGKPEFVSPKGVSDQLRAGLAQSETAANIQAGAA